MSMVARLDLGMSNQSGVELSSEEGNAVETPQGCYGLHLVFVADRYKKMKA